MYWYMKYPLIAALALVVLGGSWLALRSSDKPVAANKGTTNMKCIGTAGALYAGDPQPAPVPPVPEVKPVPATLPIPETKAEVKAEVPAAPVVPAAKLVVVDAKPEVPVAVPAVPEVKPPAVEAKPAVPAVVAVKAEEKPAAPATPFDLQFKKAVALAENGDYMKGRDLLEQLLSSPEVKLFDPQWEAVSEKVGILNSIFASTDLRCPEKVAYTVKEGDVLIKLAYRNGTTVEQLTKNNPSLQKPRAVIHPGQTLYILKGDWKLVAYRSQYKMLVYNGDKLFKVYRIAIGKEGRTPQGSFLIDDKVKEPPFRDIPYSGDAKTGNPLGTRWMRLKPIEDTPADLAGYGIHGTWNNDSLGKPASNGCLRMANSDVEELFDLLPMKAETVRVEIKE